MIVPAMRPFSSPRMAPLTFLFPVSFPVSMGFRSVSVIPRHRPRTVAGLARVSSLRPRLVIRGPEAFPVVPIVTDIAEMAFIVYIHSATRDRRFQEFR
jgi:hypothetical protein